jgi:lipoprotein-anchoring transpeptidase ErfK/SrfK
MRKVFARRAFGRKVLISAVVALAMGAAACSPGAKWNAPGETPDPPKVNLSAPADGSTDVPTSAELVFTVEGTQDVQVSLSDAGGNAIKGAMRTDGSSWIPDEQLGWATKYSATIKAKKSDGTEAEAKSTFTTMDKPDKTVRVQSDVGDNETYGIGMPIIIKFSQDVPESARADVQKRLFVTSNPPQEGVWHWIESAYHNPGSEVHFRPKDYWQPHTKVKVRVATGGVPWGIPNIYGGNDLSLDFSIGDAVTVDVDNASKQMTVTQNGQVVRTQPVSLGKPAAPSSSGNLVIFEKHETELFSSATFGTPVNSPDGYSTNVQWVMKLTQGGEYIHAAPWSVNQQGNTNVSHGCVNVTTEAAQWLFGLAPRGTPVVVKGTEVHVVWGNGYTDWDRSWEDYVKGSAIPYVPPAAVVPSPSAS